MASLSEILNQLTKAGSLYLQEEATTVRCVACAHRCRIQEGKHGICQMRTNQNGVLKVPWGYVSSAQIDPIEKKPFAHFLPGSNVLTFGMLGCNFHCSFCQNWITSQTFRDPEAELPTTYIQQITPEQIVGYARQKGVNIIASSYNEPLITTEWAVDIFRLAKKEGLRCAYVSNGYGTNEVLEYLQPYLDAIKIDLKSMQEENYKKMGGKLSHVLETIQKVHEMGIWVEIVTLVIPDYNDSTQELWDAARYITSIDRDIPWHVTAFHPDYRMADKPPTSAKVLQQAAEIGQEAGLNYVYAGNLPGKVGSLENTHCPVCQHPVIKRRGYTITAYELTTEGNCKNCGNHVSGLWTNRPDEINLDKWGFPSRIRW